MLLSEYKFGYADATKELMIEPEIFEKAFYDPHNILDKLMNSWKYMLVGRKGIMAQLSRQKFDVFIMN